MARIIIKLSLGGVAAATAALLVVAPALAYVVGTGSFLSAPAVVPVGASFTITATFIQPSGAPFPAGVTVTFTETSGPVAAAQTGGAVAAKASTGATSVHLMAAVTPMQNCAASFAPTNTTTNSAGQASSTVVLPCAGQFALTATATGSSSGSVSATVTAVAAASAQQQAPSQQQASGVFPNTSTLPPGTSGQAWIGPALVSGGGAALLIALVGFMYWRQRRSRHEA